MTAVGRVRLAILTILTIAAPIVAAPSAGAQPEPSLRIVPEPTTAGNTVTAFGTGFCAAPPCPAVVLTVGNRIAATATVDSTGSFSANFTVPTIPNQYVVTADQAANPPVRASTGLLVVASDVPPPSSPTSRRSPSTTSSSRALSDSSLPRSTTTTTTITTATRSSGTNGKRSSESDTGLVVSLTAAAAALAAILTGLWLRRRHRD